VLARHLVHLALDRTDPAGPSERAEGPRGQRSDDSSASVKWFVDAATGRAVRPGRRRRERRPSVPKERARPKARNGTAVPSTAAPQTSPRRNPFGTPNPFGTGYDVPQARRLVKPAEISVAAPPAPWSRLTGRSDERVPGVRRALGTRLSRGNATNRSTLAEVGRSVDPAVAKRASPLRSRGGLPPTRRGPWRRNGGPGGRARSTRYLRRARRYRAGENLAWSESRRRPNWSTSGLPPHRTAASCWTPAFATSARASPRARRSPPPARQ